MGATQWRAVDPGKAGLPGERVQPVGDEGPIARPPDVDLGAGALEVVVPRLLLGADAAGRGLQLGPDDAVAEDHQVGKTGLISPAVCVVPVAQVEPVAQVGHAALESGFFHDARSRGS
jgi:hypothetical protein